MEQLVGIDIGGTKMLMCAPCGDGYRERRILTGRDCPPERILQQWETFLQELPYRPRGVGVAIPGLVDGNRVQLSDVLPLLAGVTTEDFGKGRFPVTFLNDVKAAVLAEAAQYPADKTVAVIMSGTGIALGVCQNRIPFEGGRGFAGELGYSVTDTPDGIQPFCRLAGGAALLKKAGCSPEELWRRLQSEDKEAQGLIREAGRYFGIAMTNVIHLFNPDVLVVGGSTATYPGYLEAAQEAVNAYTLEDFRTSCLIAHPHDEKRIVALGLWNTFAEYCRLHRARGGSNQVKSIKRLLPFLKPYRKHCIAGPVFKLIEAILELYLPLIMARVIDQGVATGDSGYILRMGGIMLGVVTVGLLCALVCQYVASIASQGFGTEVRNALFSHIQSLSHREMDRGHAVSHQPCNQ